MIINFQNKDRNINLGYVTLIYSASGYAMGESITNSLIEKKVSTRVPCPMGIEPEWAIAHAGALGTRLSPSSLFHIYIFHFPNICFGFPFGWA
jgi:hypothetical protein